MEHIFTGREQRPGLGDVWDLSLMLCVEAPPWGGEPGVQTSVRACL